MVDIHQVIWSQKVEKQLNKLPQVIQMKFYAWVTTIELGGLNQARKSKGLHDEPLRGKRKGQRSVRLNKAYRAIYEIRKDGSVELIEVMEVNKHEY